MSVVLVLNSVTSTLQWIRQPEAAWGLVVGHVEGRQVARGSDVATSGGGGATQRHSLSTCHPDGVPIFLEEYAAMVPKLLIVRLITKGRKNIFCMFVG